MTAFISAGAVALMAAGFATTFVAHPNLSLPGPAAVPVQAVVRLEVNDVGLWAMSAGILLLAIIPMLRVLLSLFMFLVARRLLDALIAGIILLELLLSTHVR